MPLILTVDTEEEVEERREKAGQDKEEKLRTITRWDEEARVIYRGNRKRGIHRREMDKIKGTNRRGFSQKTNEKQKERHRT